MTNQNEAHAIAKMILDNVEDGIFLIDASGQLIAFNAGACRLTGYELTEVLNQPWGSSLKFVDQHGEPVAPGRNPVTKILQTEQVSRQQDICLLAKDGGRVPIHIIVSRTPDGEVVGVIRDMSLEKKEELAQTDFVSTASHEMRTPLAALEGYLSLMQEQALAEPMSEYVEKAHQSVVRLGQLFKDLLTVTQGDDNQLIHQDEIFNLEDLLQQLVKEKQAEAKKKQIKLQLDLTTADEDELIIVNADPVRIKELFENIVNNALKYTQPGGSIAISIEITEDIYHFRISDTGLGIAKKDLPHIFQKFYRVTSDQPGTGLGLFICRQIVDLYHGDLWADSELGKGSVFHVTLPRRDPF